MCAKAGCHIAPVPLEVVADAAPEKAIVLHCDGHAVGCSMQLDGSWLVSDDTYGTRCRLAGPALHSLLVSSINAGRQAVVWEVGSGVYPHLDRTARRRGWQAR